MTIVGITGVIAGVPRKTIVKFLCFSINFMIGNDVRLNIAVLKLISRHSAQRCVFKSFRFCVYGNAVVRKRKSPSHCMR